jgi:putative FmdB family regulatory protein
LELRGDSAIIAFFSSGEIIMPLYEYKCDRCGSVEEAIQRVADSPLKKCSQCGGPLHKLMSSPAIQFKGSGWYVTDYASKKTPPSPANKDAKKTEPKKEKSEEKSKAAAKSPSPNQVS